MNKMISKWAVLGSLLMIVSVGLGYKIDPTRAQSPITASIDVISTQKVITALGDEHHVQLNIDVDTDPAHAVYIEIHYVRLDQVGLMIGSWQVGRTYTDSSGDVDRSDIWFVFGSDPLVHDGELAEFYKFEIHAWRIDAQGNKIGSAAVHHDTAASPE